MKYKIFIPCLDGFGDMLIANNAGYFARKIGKDILGKLHTAYNNNLIEDICVVINPNYAASAMKEVWESLPIPIRCVPLEDLFSPSTYCGSIGNILPNTSPSGYLNARTNMPIDIHKLQSNIIDFPYKKPEDITFPDRYIFFTAEAGSPARFLIDQEIIDTIRLATTCNIIQGGAKIVRAYHTLSPITVTGYPLTVDLRPIPSVLEMLWIAKNSILVISSVTSLRAMSIMANVPVIELIDHTNSNKDMNLTKEVMNDHYTNTTYDLKNHDNWWYNWPEQTSEFIDKITELIK